MTDTTQHQTNWRERSTVTVEEAAVILGVSRATAYEAARQGELPTVTLGRRILVPTVRLRRVLGELDQIDQPAK